MDTHYLFHDFSGLIKYCMNLLRFKVRISLFMLFNWTSNNVHYSDFPVQNSLSAGLAWEKYLFSWTIFHFTVFGVAENVWMCSHTDRRWRIDFFLQNKLTFFPHERSHSVCPGEKEEWSSPLDANGSICDCVCRCGTTLHNNNAVALIDCPSRVCSSELIIMHSFLSRAHPCVCLQSDRWGTVWGHCRAGILQRARGQQVHPADPGECQSLPPGFRRAQRPQGLSMCLVCLHVCLPRCLLRVCLHLCKIVFLLRFWLLVRLFVCLPSGPSTCLLSLHFLMSVDLVVYLSVYLFVYFVSFYLSVYLSTWCLSTYVFTCLSICLSWRVVYLGSHLCIHVFVLVSYLCFYMCWST